MSDAEDRFRDPLVRIGRFADEVLPAWLKSAKNRGEVLRGIRRLRSSLPAGRQ